jgi:hypothetical protein
VEEREFRDGAHGFMVWATGVVFGAIVIALVGGATAFTAVRSASTIAAGAAGGATAQALARGPADYAVDLLLRPAPTNANQAASPSVSGAAATDSGRAPNEALRAETTRIFRTAIDNRALTQRDRDYLAQVVAARAGLPEAEAQKRVDEAVKEAQTLEVKAREAADKARKTAVITGFMAAASLLLGLAAACIGASLGGRHRTENLSPAFYGRRFW